jgi:hypothetical protein
MHYHISWSTVGYDWERFESHEVALKAASLIVKPDEASPFNSSATAALYAKS